MWVICASVEVDWAIPGQFVPFWRQTEDPFTLMLDANNCEPEALVKNRSVVVTCEAVALVSVRVWRLELPETVRLVELSVAMEPEVAMRLVENKLVAVALPRVEELNVAEFAVSEFALKVPAFKVVTVPEVPWKLVTNRSVVVT